MMMQPRQAGSLVKEAVTEFVADGALSRGAAIAYYTVFSLGPVLLIVVAVAGLAFGDDAARGAIAEQLGGLMGEQSAAAVQGMIDSAGRRESGLIATAIGLATLIVTASGVFGEIQAALNAIWKAEPSSGTVSRLVRARLTSLGLVMALGFLLLVSLVVSAVLQAVGTWMSGLLPAGGLILNGLSTLVSLLLIAVMFGAIYKVLPDTDIAWSDVMIGALATSFLFSVGKFLISLYIGSSSIASSYGAAGALVIILVWIYYSAQIFLLGAEFTKVYARARRSPQEAGHEPQLARLKRELHGTGSR